MMNNNLHKVFFFFLDNKIYKKKKKKKLPYQQYPNFVSLPRRQLKKQTHEKVEIQGYHKMMPVFLHIQLYQYLHTIVDYRRWLQKEDGERKDIFRQFSTDKDNLIMKSLQVNMTPRLETQPSEKI